MFHKRSTLRFNILKVCRGGGGTADVNGPFITAVPPYAGFTGHPGCAVPPQMKGYLHPEMMMMGSGAAAVSR